MHTQTQGGSNDVQPFAAIARYCPLQDRVLLTTDAEGMKVYKVITRQTRRPEVGSVAQDHWYVLYYGYVCACVYVCGQV